MGRLENGWPVEEPEDHYGRTALAGKGVLPGGAAEASPQAYTPGRGTLFC